MSNNTVFFCKECGYESAKWLGKCPGCASWNSFVEEKINIKNKKSNSKSSFKTTASTLKKLSDIQTTKEIRIDTGYEEVNRVFGGGIVKGTLNLIGGEPGIGKSTLIMQICDRISKNYTVLYVSGEESDTQVKLRSDRLGVDSDKIMFLGETNIDVIEEKIEDSKAEFCIIDSIQTMYDEEISSVSGSISQVKEVTARLMQIAKQKNITIVLIGHVTKDGVIAGPRILEHMVDTVIYIEGENFSTYRIIRSIKNRFGSTNEIGIFDMQDSGMVEVKNISQVFLSEINSNLPGTSVFATVEGTSTILIEIQALTSHSYYNMPRRVANGIDLNRLNMILAVLEKKTNINLGTDDVYVNVIGGLKVSEPALDLATAVAIVSSKKNILPNTKTVYVGEIGLTGEIRGVSNFSKRLKEIEKMGYDQVITSKKQIEKLSTKDRETKVKLIGYSSIDKLIESMI